VPPPLSSDLRLRVIEAVQQGRETWQEVADRFDVGRASVNRLVRLFRATGGIDPKPATGGTEPKISDGDLEVLRQVLTDKPDLTLPELAVELGERTDVWVSEATIGRAVRDRLKFSRKKRPLFQRNASAHR
jgi:transposase